MYKIISFLAALIIAFTGIQQPVHTAGGIAKKGGTFAKSLGDDDPIVMRSHVRTGGGLPIAGASVTLTATGTSLPQYSGLTDSSGDFTWDQVAQGNYSYRISKNGYQNKSVNLSLTSNTERTDTLVAN